MSMESPLPDCPTMTPTPGEPSSSERLSGDRTLDEYERSLGLPATCPNPVEVEATRLLSLLPEELRHLTDEECGEAAFVLEQYAFYLQRSINREQVKMHRADAILRRLLPELLAGRREYMFEEKKMMAISESSQCVAMERQRLEAQFRVDRLVYLANRVSALSGLFVNLQQLKGRKL